MFLFLLLFFFFIRVCPAKKKCFRGRAWFGEVVPPAATAVGLYFVRRSKYCPAGFHSVFCSGFARRYFFKEPEKYSEKTYYPYYIVFDEVAGKKNAFACRQNANNQEFTHLIQVHKNRIILITSNFHISFIYFPDLQSYLKSFIAGVSNVAGRQHLAGIAGCTKKSPQGF